MMRQGSDSGRLHLLWASLAYLLLAIVFTFPLIRSWRTAVPNDVGDPILNAWILWWDSIHVPLTNTWWQAPAFFPARDVLTFSEHLLGIALFSAPIQWITHEPILAYNVVFLLSYALSGFTAYLLVLEITGRHDAAWVAGVLFALAPYRAEQVSHIQVLSSYWMPLALASLHKYVRTSRPRWLVAFWATLTLQGLANGYFLLFFPVLVALWVLWFTPLERIWQSVVGIGAAVLAAGIVWVPFLLRYQSAHVFYGFVRQPLEIRGFSADLASLLTASDRLQFWSGLQTYPKPEGSLFPGLAAPLLVIGAVVLWRPRRARVEVKRSRTVVIARAVLGLATFALALALASYWWLGPWRVSVAGLTISVTRADSLFAKLLVAGGAFTLSSPRMLSARRDRAVFGFYVAAAVLMWILALGPSPAWRGEIIPHVTAPYSWLLALPGFDGLRVPARFWMLAVVCLSAAAGCAYARLVRPDWKGTWTLAAVVTCVAFADGWMGPMPMVEEPHRSPLLEQVVRHPVLELPMDAGDFDRAAMYRGIYTGQPVGNGTSGYTAPHYAALEWAVDHQNPRILAQLSMMGLRDLRVDRRRDPDGKYASFVSAYPGVARVGEDDNEVVFRLPEAGSLSRTVTHGDKLPISELSANVSQQLLPNLLDSDQRTRWETGPQEPGQQLVVTLQAEQALGAVEFDLGPSTADFPRGLEIAISTDGANWTTVRSGSTAIEALLGALAQPGVLPVTFDLGGARARYVRLRQTGADPTFYWSATELAVYGVKN